MVSKIFPADELADKTVEFARRIAKVPTMAALLIKESVNQTQDNQGFYNLFLAVMVVVGAVIVWTLAACAGLTSATAARRPGPPRAA